MIKLAKAWRRAIATAILGLIPALPAQAGPPYVTDDPEPTDTGHWEIYNFAALTHTPGVDAGQGGFDINYGGAKDLQLTAVIPIDYASGVSPALGDIQLAAKYKFLHQSDKSWTPDVAFFPRLFVPAAPKRFGEETPSLLLPIWGEKDFGKWSLFGGGGYDINPGRDNRSYWLTGLALSRQIGERFSLGAEVYHQTPALQGDRPYTGVNVGATYKLSRYWTLMGAGGPGVQNATGQGQYNVYLALEATY